MNENPLGLTNPYLLAQQEHPHKASGIDGMNNFPTKPSSETIIFEANSDIFCAKETDANNAIVSCRYFAFQEISKEEAMRQISPYLMKGELDSFKDDIMSSIRSELSSFKEDILNGQQFIRKNGTAVNDANDSNPY